jgi:hypothetical protein
MGLPPRSLTAEANGCFMVRVPHGPNRIQGCGASIAPERGLSSDQLYRTSNNGEHRVAVTLDTKVLIQGCVKTPTSDLHVELLSRLGGIRKEPLCQSPSKEEKRENNSAHSLRVHVFTQPGSFSIELGCPRHVRFPPVSDRIADIAGGPKRATSRRGGASFYHLVGDRKNAGRNGQAEGPWWS